MAFTFGLGAAAAGAAGGITVTTVATAVVGSLVSIGVSKLFAKKPAASSSSFDSQARGALVNIASNVAEIPVVYGRRRVGGARVFADTSGTTNEFLHCVYAVAEGEIDAFEGVYVDDVISTDAKWTLSGGTYLGVENYVGTDAQTASAGLIAALPTKWTSAHRLRGVAYSIVTFTYTDELYSGLPDVTFEIRGRKVYDPRTTLTAWSQNPALCIRDYLTNTRFGRGIPSSFIDDASFIAAADYCDDVISTPGGNQARYTCNVRLSVDADPLDNLRALLSSCRGYLTFSAGKYKIGLFKQASPSGFAFTEDNIVGNWQIRLPGKRDKANRVKAQFFAPDRDWQADYAIFDSTAYRAEDNGLDLQRDLDLPCCTNYYEALRQAELECRETRYATTCSFTATVAALEVELGDVVTITHSTPGWSGALFRVTDIEPLSTDEIRIVAQQYSDDAYALGSPPTRTSPPATSLPDPSVVSAVTGLALSYTTINYYGNLELTWAAHPDAYVRNGGRIETIYKRNAASEWLQGPTALGSDTKLRWAPTEGATDYQVKARAVNSAGFVGPWSSIVSTTYGGFGGVLTGMAGTIGSSQIGTGAVTSAALATGAVTSGAIASGAVGTAALGTGAVTAGAIAPGAVGTAALGTGAVTAAALATGAVTSGALASGAVGTAALATGAVTAGAIAPGAVGTAALGTGAVTASALATGAVTSGAIAAGAVGTAAIGTGAVTAPALASGAVTSSAIAAGAVGTAALGTGAVTSAALATGAVTSSAIAAGAVGTAALGTGAVTSSALASGAVTSSAIAAGAVGTAALGTGAVTSSAIASGAVGTAALGTGVVLTEKVAANAVSTLVVASLDVGNLGTKAVTVAGGATEILTDITSNFQIVVNGTRNFEVQVNCAVSWSALSGNSESLYVYFSLYQDGVAGLGAGYVLDRLLGIIQTPATQFTINDANQVANLRSGQTFRAAFSLSGSTRYCTPRIRIGNVGGSSCTPSFSNFTVTGQVVVFDSMR